MEKSIDLSDVNSLRETYAREDDIVVLAVDPGVTTGVSVMSAQYDDKSKTYVTKSWGSNQISYGGSGNVGDVINDKNPEELVASYIVSLLEGLVEALDQKRVFLVIEDFIVRQMNQSREFLSPVRVTSALMGMVYYSNVIPMSHIFMQTPADAKSVCTDKRMDKWGFVINTQKDRHSRDADRHATLFLRRCSEKQGRNLPTE